MQMCILSGMVLKFEAHWAAHSKGKTKKVARNRFARYLKKKAAAPATTNEEQSSIETEIEELEAWISSDNDSAELLGVIHNANKEMTIPDANVDLEPKIRDPETGRAIIVRSWKKIRQIGNDSNSRVKIAPKYYNKSGRGLIGTSEKNISQSLEDF